MQPPTTGYDGYILKRMRKVIADCRLRQVYVVGGTCRDWQLKVSPNDFDMVCLGKDIETLVHGIEEGFKTTKAERKNGQVPLQFKEVLPVIRISEAMSRGTELYRITLQKLGVSGPEADRTVRIDIRELVGGTIESDVQRCDFTINAIYYDINNNTYFDPTDVS